MKTPYHISEGGNIIVAALDNELLIWVDANPEHVYLTNNPALPNRIGENAPVIELDVDRMTPLHILDAIRAEHPTT